MSGLGFGAVTAAATKPATTPSATKTHTAADDFLAYMKESPAERMMDSWLAAHGLSKEALAAMPPEKRDAILKQMAKELQDQIAQTAREKAEKKTPSVGTQAL